MNFIPQAHLYRFIKKTRFSGTEVQVRKVKNTIWGNSQRKKTKIILRKRYLYYTLDSYIISFLINFTMQGDFDSQGCKKYVNKVFEESIVPSLKKYIEIPNLSRNFYATEDWANGLKQMQEAANHVKEWVAGFGIKGLTTEIIQDEGRAPIVFTEIAGDIPEKTIFFYGHYDKQPYDENDWTPPRHPTKPYIDENERLYGRGGADDGYSTYSSMLAVKTVQEQGLPIPRIVMITEGDEESGDQVNDYIDRLQDRIGNPEIVFCLDSGSLDYKRFYITKSLRGYLAGTLRAEIMSEGVHSGDASGVVPSVYRILNMLINRVQDVNTGIVHPSFHMNVPADRYAEVCKLVDQLGDQAIKEYPYVGNTTHVAEDTQQLVLNRTWRPQLTVTGISGLPSIINAGNVSRPYIEAKLSLRAPPTLDGKGKSEQLKVLLQNNPPYSCNTSFKDIAYGNGWNCPKYSTWLEATLEDAGKEYFGHDLEYQGEGGSIPLMGFLNDKWKNAQFVVTGVLGPHSNAHGPDEFLDIPYCKKLTQAMAYVVFKTGQQFLNKN